jgi:hypothetical protein
MAENGFGIVKKRRLTGNNAKSYATVKLLHLDFRRMSFFVSVILQCKNGNGNKRVCCPHDARIVVSSVTLSSGVRFRAIFTFRKGFVHVFVDQMDLGIGQLLNSHRKRNKNSDKNTWTSNPTSRI